MRSAEWQPGAGCSADGGWELKNFKIIFFFLLNLVYKSASVVSVSSRVNKRSFTGCERPFCLCTSLSLAFLHELIQ